MRLTNGTPRLLPTSTPVWCPMVCEIVETAVWAVHAKSAVVQFPTGRRRPECICLGFRELTENGESVRDGLIEKTIRFASPFKCCSSIGFSLDDTQQQHGAHRVFVADALEPRGQGLITLRSRAYRPNGGIPGHTGSIRSRSLTRSTTVASMISVPS
jgi:hypothetical protein